MNTKAKIAAALATLFLAGSAVAHAHTVKRWTLTGLSNPESVLLDVAKQYMYVSNINGGGPTGKDGNGFISKISRDGKMLEQKWITGGLHAPKGLVMNGSKLYVSDVDRLAEIDTNTGKITAFYDAPGAVFLNDTAVDAAGNVYVSDIAKRKIWQLKDGKMSVWYEKDDLMHPNGLRVIYGGKLLVAGWGKDMQEDGSTKVPGNLFTIDLATKELKNLGNGAAIGNLDGIGRDAHGNFLVTDFMAGGLYRVRKDGTSEQLVDLKSGSADLDVIGRGHIVVIPQMMESEVTAYWVD